MAPSKIFKKDIEKIIERKRGELKQKQEFVSRLKVTIKLEEKKISELEGAILALHEVLTGEKVE